MRVESYGLAPVEFIQSLKLASAGFRGEPFVLRPWQKQLIMDFYGEQKRDENGYYRHYQYLYLEIPKKNGKTETIAGLGLYHLVADEEPNPQVYIVAADKNNASICYDAMCGMVEQAKWLQKRVKTLPSRKEIQLRDGSGFVKVLSSDAETKHGYNPSCVIFDELHAQPNRKLWDVMTFGSQSARRQPTWLVLTTAGDDPDRNSIGWEIHEKCRRILAARAGTGNPADDDPLWLPVIYGIPDDPEEVAKIDIYDEALWYRLNPNLGVTIPIRTLRSEAASAKQSEASERLFRWLRLNQWIAVKAVGWLPLTLYDRTQWHVPRLDTMELKGPELRKRMRETLKGKKCFGGLDLSSTTDLSAFVLVFPPQPGLELWVTLFWAWRPRATVEDMEKKDHVPYRDWARAGYLSLCEGELIDFDSIKATVLEAKRIYKLQALGVDPYLSREITGYLRDRGLNVIEIRQNMAEMSPPMKEIEKLLRSGQMVHEHNTCARWCFGNVRCAVDGNENIKPMKNKSTGRIDITVAWIIAYAAAMLQPENQLADLVATGRWSL